MQPFIVPAHMFSFSFLCRFHGTSVVNFDSDRGGISLEQEKTETGTTSRLLLTRANFRDSGNYSCVPLGALSASVIVHVLNGNWRRLSLLFTICLALERKLESALLTCYDNLWLSSFHSGEIPQAMQTSDAVHPPTRPLYVALLVLSTFSNLFSIQHIIIKFNNFMQRWLMAL